MNYKQQCINQAIKLKKWLNRPFQLKFPCLTTGIYFDSLVERDRIGQNGHFESLSNENTIEHFETWSKWPIRAICKVEFVSPMVGFILHIRHSFQMAIGKMHLTLQIVRIGHFYQGSKCLMPSNRWYSRSKLVTVNIATNFDFLDQCIKIFIPFLVPISPK